MKIKITSGENYAVLGLDGAMLNSLNKNNTEYLWQGDAKYWAGQAPVCFPITGVLPNGEMEAFGKRCTMKRHGVARINPFEVLEQHKNSVTFVQRSDENTKRDFPFDYELKIKYTINGDTVTNEYIVTNTGEDKLPFVIGGHPAFNCPLTKNEKRQDYLLNLLLSDDPKQYAEFEKIWGKKFVRSDYGSLAELHKPIKEIADREGWEMIRTSGCPYGKEDPIWALYHECRRRNYGY